MQFDFPEHTIEGPSHLIIIAPFRIKLYSTFHHIVVSLRALQHSLHHAIPNFNSLGESRFEETLRGDEPLLPSLKVAEANTLGPPTCGKRELEVIAAKGVVLDGDTQRLVKAGRAAKQILGDAEPEPEEWCAADHMVKRHDAECAPAVYHGEEAEVVVGQGRQVGCALAYIELVEHGIAEQWLLGPFEVIVGSKDLLLGREDTFSELSMVAT